MLQREPSTCPQQSVVFDDQVVPFVHSTTFHQEVICPTTSTTTDAISFSPPLVPIPTVSTTSQHHTDNFLDEILSSSPSVFLGSPNEDVNINEAEGSTSLFADLDAVFGAPESQQQSDLSHADPFTFFDATAAAMQEQEVQNAGFIPAFFDGYQGLGQQQETSLEPSLPAMTQSQTGFDWSSYLHQPSFALAGQV